MKLLFLYGRLATGKLTVAREIAARTGWRLLHNHLAVDLALAVCDFGTPGFVALREQAWLAGIRRALADGRPGLIFTFAPENSVPQRFIDELFAEIGAAGSEAIPVELTAGEAEIERRLGAESRRRHGKLTEPALYRALRTQGVYDAPAMPAPRLIIDTERVEPPEAAARICALLG